MFCPAGESGSESDDFDFGDTEISLQSLSSDNKETTLDEAPVSEKQKTRKLCIVDDTKEDTQQSILLLQDFQNAIITGNVQKVNSFLKVCPELCNSPLTTGWLPLTYACYFGNLNIVRTLVAFGCDRSVTGSDGCTALMAACKSQNLSQELNDIIKLLISLKCDVFACSATSQNALMYASKHGNINACIQLLVEMLVQDQNKINAKDNKGWTALDWAIFKGNQEIVKRLLESGADICTFHEISHFAENLIELLNKVMPCKSEDNDKSVDKREYNTNNEDKSSQMPDKVNSNEDAGIDVNKLCNTSSIYENIFDSQSEQLNDESKNEVYFLKPSANVSDQTFQKFGQLELFLCGLELSHLIPLFYDHDVRFEQLLYLTIEDLITIGVYQLGARKRILDSIKDWHSSTWKEGSLPNLSQGLTLEQLRSVIQTSSEHILCISSALRYVRIQMKSQPQVFIPSSSMYLEKNPKDEFELKVADLLQSTHSLCSSMKSLHCDWVQLSKNQFVDVKYTQVDYISNTKTNNGKGKYVSIAVISLIFAILAINSETTRVRQLTNKISTTVFPKLIQWSKGWMF
nr:ankyrin repeat, SAM and basic leucine zipper domain-containing protein 1 [Ciona intestinalis]|eukprot:XP_002131363.1 ankyrin repeat, SAM and basic leucine zipper domain-containing protein 1 [Ciona intestinalis]